MKTAKIKTKRPAGSMVSVRIPNELKEQLDQIASEEGKYSSDIIKELIRARVEMREAGMQIRNTERSISMERLLDDLIQNQHRKSELIRIKAAKAALGGSPSEYFQQAIDFCERKLNQIDRKLENLFDLSIKVICLKCDQDLTA